MAHFSKVWPGGITAGVTTGNASQFATLDADHAKAVNGDDGGVWSPAAELDIGGAGLGISLPASGGSVPWPKFSNDGAGAGRTLGPRPRHLTDASFGSPSAWSVFLSWDASSNYTPQLVGQAFGGGPSGWAMVPINDQLFDGATITACSILFTTNQSHTVLPAVQPAVTLVRRGIGAYAGPTLGTQQLAAVTLGAYLNSGNEQTLSIASLSNNVVDKSHYVYFLIIADESGTGSMAGNMYHFLQLTQIIPDLRFK